LLFLEFLHLQALATSSGLLDKEAERLLDEFSVLDAQLFSNDLQVTNWIDIALDVDDLGIVEASHDLENSIDGANVRQECVSKTGTGGRAACETGNVVDGQVGGHDRLGLVHLDEVVEAIIGDDDAGFFWVDGGIGEVLMCSAGATAQTLHATYGRVAEMAFCDCLEQRRFTDIGKADLRSTVNVRT
jgi:hypothetical protein